MSRTPVSFRLPPEDRERLAFIAELLGLSRTDLIRAFIRFTYAGLQDALPKSDGEHAVG